MRSLVDLSEVWQWLQIMCVQLFSEGVRWLLLLLKIDQCYSWLLIWASWMEDEPALSKGRWVAASWGDWENSPLSGERKFVFLGSVLYFDFFFLLLSMAVREVLSSFGYGSPQCLAPSGSCKWQSGCVDLAHVNVLYLLRENISCVSQA